jgi:hypothetical protein
LRRKIPDRLAPAEQDAYTGGMRHLLRPLAATAALAVLLAVSAGAARADDIAWKIAHDTDPHLPLTSQQLQMTAAKRAAECGDCTSGGGGFASAAHLAANQTPQTTGYYCGPAAVHEALDAVGVSLSQSAAATALHTTVDGTAWSGGGTSPSGYPVPDVLNTYQSRNFYVPQYISTPSSSVNTAYQHDLEEDIAAVKSPLIGDAWETPNSAHHLVGHPTDRTIFHWFEIRGYESSGASTMYEDSVHNAGSVAWHAGVPAYSTLPSSWIVSIVAGRGYVW